MGQGLQRIEKRDFGIQARPWMLLLSKLLLVAFLLPSASQAVDLEGDGTDDLTVFRPLLGPVIGTWFVASSRDDLTYIYQWGLEDDVPVAGNFTGGAGSDLVVWRPTDGVWYLRHYDASLDFSDASAYQWGLSGDTALRCDLTGDGPNELTVFRNSNGTWYSRNSAVGIANYSTATVQPWGLSGDTPAPADYDGDDKCDYAVFRDGNWYVILSASGGTDVVTIGWGTTGDIPVPADYDADGITDFAVYRESASSGPTWFIRQSSKLSDLATFGRSLQWGLVGDVPLVTDVTGDGLVDITVWRPSTGIWYVLTSESDFASALAFQFGLPVDIPQGR
ncbi:MAG: VCBS repeat-containing protein [Deltaproteobacteria bacterium]|nr:VCBS repeat-containing protein [Deltaproteobacteria bacterium]